MSIFDSLTTETNARKATAAAALTPLPKASPLPNHLPNAFPNDHPHEVVESAVRSIRREVEHILAALDSIDATNGVPPVDVEQMTPAEARKIEEKVADEMAAARSERNFNEEFKAKQEAAQSATFTAAEPATAQGWVCPEHGADRLKTLSGRKRGDYLVCGVCGEYEREVQS